jgi:hypothetical protein
MKVVRDERLDPLLTLPAMSMKDELLLLKNRFAFTSEY